MAQIEYTDQLVQEYLLFRGFSTTLKSFHHEKDTSKEKETRAEKIINILMKFIITNDLTGLKEFWNKLDQNLFCRLEYNYISGVKKLENGLLKLYLVTAHINNKTDKVIEFFNGFKMESSSQNEWKDWFYFPFCKNPEEIPTFSFYFSKNWQDTFWLSLNNFLMTIFQCMPMPTIARVDDFPIALKIQEQQQKLTPVSKNQKANQQATNVNEIQPFDVTPPGHILDDFYIIAAENDILANAAEVQAKGIKSFIKTISSSSPVFGRKDT